MPVTNCGDGVSVNQKDARILSDLFGFDSPGIKTSLLFNVCLIKNFEFIKIFRKLIISIKFPQNTTFFERCQLK